MSTPPSNPSGRCARQGPRLLVLAGLLTALLVPIQLAAPARVDAATVEANGFTTSARTSTTLAPRGSVVTLRVTVTAAMSRRELVDVEVYDAYGNKAFQQYWDAQWFDAGTSRTFTARWTIPTTQPRGRYRVDVGVFATGWAGLHHWNSGATALRVTSATSVPTTTLPPAPTTTRPPAPTTTAPPPPPPPPAPTTTLPAPTTTLPAPTTTRPAPPTTTPPPAGGRFVTLPPGSALPDDATCAARVRPAPEIRAANSTANHTRGRGDTSLPGVYGRVTGNFVGTTDEIIQWAACKWGFDEDVIRAQTAKESWWMQSAAGDWSSDATHCAPGHAIGQDGRPGMCPESFGVQQVRYPYWQFAFPYAITSTAYNLDAALAARRSCFEGNETWLNQFERGREYAAGDLWGCVGNWFSGRWYTPDSVTYIAAVQDYLNQRIWLTDPFITFTG